jgi:hypothetical protein
MNHTTITPALTTASRLALTLALTAMQSFEGSTAFKDSQAAEGWTEADFQAAMAEIQRLQELTPALSHVQTIYTAFRAVLELAGEAAPDLALNLYGDGSGDIAHMGRATQPSYIDPEALNLTLWADEQNGAAMAPLLLTYLRAVGGYDPDTLVTEAWDAFNGTDRRPAPLAEAHAEAHAEAGAFEALIDAYKVWIEVHGCEESTLEVWGSGKVVLRHHYQTNPLVEARNLAEARDKIAGITV